MSRRLRETEEEKEDVEEERIGDLDSPETLLGTQLVRVGELKLLVSNLPPQTTYDSLLNRFSQFGCLLNVRICHDKHPSKCNGLGFITFLRFPDGSPPSSTCV